MTASIILKDETGISTPPAGYTALRANDGVLYSKDDNGAERSIMGPRLGNYAAGDTTPTVAGMTALDISNSSPTTITAIDDGVAGQIVALLFRDSNTTIQAAAINTGSNFVSSAGASILIVRFTDGWHRIS